ncbi:hypothetical protein ON010_g14230 [Phytophthora cinnamomi]|nr:hypothetical protein ON010_g14230 [Phytophthora cinnamomi]
MNDYRQTVDYKPLNAQVEGIAGITPNPQVDLELVRGSVDEACQEMISYMTHLKIYTPRRVPQGYCDAALLFQATLEKCLTEPTYKHQLVWIDDLAFFAVDVKTYLPRPRTDPGADSTAYPTNAAELQKVLCAANWMRESVVDFARAAQPLQERLDLALATASRRTKRVAAGVSLEFASLAFPQPNSVICLIIDASDVGYGIIVKRVRNWQSGKAVAEQQHELLVCVSGTFTDSKRNWSVIEKEAYPIICACDQLSHLLLRPEGFRLFCDHRNLIYVFAPGREVKKHIRGKLLRWAMKLMEYKYRIEHIEGSNNVWADMVSQWAGNHQRRVALRVMLLRMRGREKEERTQQIRSKRRRGEEDRTPKTQSKRRRGETDRTPVTRRQRKLRTEGDARLKDASVAAIRPFDDPNFSWPKLHEIVHTQEKYRNTVPSNFLTEVNSGKGWYHQGKLWIPTKDKSLLQRLMVVEPCGAQGHRGRATMIEQLQRHVYEVM